MTADAVYNSDNQERDRKGCNCGVGLVIINKLELSLKDWKKKLTKTQIQKHQDSQGFWGRRGRVIRALFTQPVKKKGVRLVLYERIATHKPGKVTVVDEALGA